MSEAVYVATVPKAATAIVEPILDISDLRTWFFTRDGVVRAVDGVSFHVLPGETLAIVGESGCGKSVTALSILRLIPSPPGRIVSGKIRFAGRDLLGLSEAEMRQVRGNEVSMIFQEPMTSLNPVLTIGRQIAETLTLHQGVGHKAEEAPVSRLFRRPLHPYTKGLLASVPRLGASLDHKRAPRLAEIAGTVPSLREPIPGCPFETRCTFATDICRREMPAFDEKEPGHFAACFHSDRVAAA